jgi:S-formylglutathione hydrolase FrmB
MQDPVTGERSAFYTNWFSAENNYNPEYNMIVVDRTQRLITFDGETWQDIEEDHL